MPKLKPETSEPKTEADLRPGGNARQMLYSFVQRVERLTEEKDVLVDDIREVYGEAKGLGFDATILRKVIARRKKATASVREGDAIMELYEETIEAAEKAELAQAEKDSV